MSKKARDAIPQAAGKLPLAATSQICKNCDAYFPKESKTCPSCGTQVA